MVPRAHKEAALSLPTEKFSRFFFTGQHAPDVLARMVEWLDLSLLKKEPKFKTTFRQTCHIKYEERICKLSLTLGRNSHEVLRHLKGEVGSDY